MERRKKKEEWEIWRGWSWFIAMLYGKKKWNRRKIKKTKRMNRNKRKRKKWKIIMKWRKIRKRRGDENSKENWKKNNDENEKWKEGKDENKENEKIVITYYTVSVK